MFEMTTELYILAIPPPNFLQIEKQGRIWRRNKKTEEFEETRNKTKSQKTGKNFDRGGDNFSGWPEYIPLLYRFTF